MSAPQPSPNLVRRFVIAVLFLSAALHLGQPARANAHSEADRALKPNYHSQHPVDPTKAIYLIQQGDTLWSIFTSLEGGGRWSPNDWKALKEANPTIQDPNVMIPGMNLVIPPELRAVGAAMIRPPYIQPLRQIEPTQSRLIPAAAAAEFGSPAVPVPPKTLRIQLPSAIGRLGGWLAPFQAAGAIRPELLHSLLLVLLVIALVKFSPTQRELRWVLVPLACFLGVRYLLWRGMHTLNVATVPSSAISITVLLAEIYGFLAMVLFYAQVIKEPKERNAPAWDERELPSVDVFITIYNESVDILKKTLIACCAMDYPSDRLTIYVLDDGGRDEVKKLSQSMGCKYLARESHEHAKSGNVNHALPLTSGEFIMMLDCDHVPVRSFLKETIGFFKDEKVAFVQTPHYFYNSDTYQHNLRLESEVINEQDLFFYVIEPGKDASNSTFFAGSSGIFRRRPLVEIGGFQVASLIEDMHTSMALHAEGYKSVYLNKILTGALSPESYRSYLKQRQRWTRGGIQVFIFDNPLIKRGLSFMQRINYFASIFYFFHGIPRLIYLAAPVSFLLFNITPVSCDVITLISYYAPFYVAALTAFWVTSNEFRNPFWSDVYESVVCFSLSVTAIGTLLQPYKLKFEVTPKGTTVTKARLDWHYVIPHLALLGLLLVGSVVGFYHLGSGGVDINSTLLSIVWTVYNVLVIATAITVARSRPQLRTAHRLRRRFACEVRFDGNVIPGTTLDLSETGMSFIIKHEVLLPQMLEVRLTGPLGETTDINAEIIRNGPVGRRRANVGLQFKDVTEEQKQSLTRQLFSAPDSWRRVRRPTPTIWRSLGLMAIGWLRVPRTPEMVTRKFSPRVSKHMDCEIVSNGSTFHGVTGDISTSGLSVVSVGKNIRSDDLMIRLLPLGQEKELSIRGKVVRRKKTSSNGDTLLGIHFLERKDHELAGLVQST